MAYGIVNKFSGGTREQYDAAIEVVHPADGLPAGQTHHYAGRTADGWVVVAIWDSEESWTQFRDETLMPGLGSLGDRGFPGPPEVTTFEIEVEKQG